MWLRKKEYVKVMKQMKVPQLAVVLGMGLFMVACGGEGGEGPIVPPPPAPAEWADKHMPAGWWADAAKLEEGRKLYIGETNPDVNCGSCHGKDGKPAKAGARDFRVCRTDEALFRFRVGLADCRRGSQYEDEGVEEQAVGRRCLEAGVV